MRTDDFHAWETWVILGAVGVMFFGPWIIEQIARML